MLGSSAANATKRVRLTLEIPEHQQDAILRFLSQQETCEVVSIRRVQSGNGRKRFAVPRDVDPTPLPPVRLCQRRSTTSSVAEVAQQPSAAPSGDRELDLN